MAARPDDPDDAGPAAPGTPSDEPSGEPSTAGPTSDDEQWAAIVAQLGDLAGLDGTTDEERVDPPTDDDRQAQAGAADPGTAGRLSFPVAPWVAQPHVVRPATDGSFDGRDWDGTSQYDEAEAAVDAEEHFVPPDPGPVLGGDPLLTMAWFAAIGMPLFLLGVLLVWRGAPEALVQAAAVVFALGVAVLVWRMPHRRDPDDDDSGAVV